MIFKAIKKLDKKEDFEEISEKRTSKLGYIILFLMVFFVIGIGQTVFHDLSKIAKRPTYPAYCIKNIVNKNQNYLHSINYLPTCRFSELDTEYGTKQLYEKIKPTINQIISINKQLNTLNNKKSTVNRNTEKLKKDYDLSLQEKQAGIDGIYEEDTIQKNIINTQPQLNQVNKEINKLNNKKTLLLSSISKDLTDLKNASKKAQKQYEYLYALYRLKIFLLNLLFVLPLFILSVKYYFKHKRKNSPYTIIFTAILTATSILFLQVIGVFLYEILPKTWLSKIFTFFLEMPFLRYILYYGSIAIVLFIFGGIVYLIQKNVYNPQKVAIRRLKDNKCPGCAFTLDHNHVFCPKCGQKLKDTCVHCGKQKVHYLEHCPNCGKK